MGDQRTARKRGVRPSVRVGRLWWAIVAVAIGGVGAVANYRPATTEAVHTIIVGQEPTAAAFDARRGLLFVLNTTSSTGTGTVSVVDIHRGAIVRTIPVGIAPNAMVVDEAVARIFVSNAGDGTLSVLDARRGIVVHTIGIGAAPIAMAVDVHAGLVFLAVSANGSSSIWLLDARSGAVRRTINLGGDVEALAVDEQTHRLFAPSAAAKAVFVLVARSGTIARVTPLGGTPIGAPIVDAHGKRVLVLVATPSGAGWVSVIDALTGRMQRVMAVGQMRDPMRMRLIGDWGACACIALVGDRDIRVLHASTGAAVRTIPIRGDGGLLTGDGGPLTVAGRSGLAFIAMPSPTDRSGLPIDRGQLIAADVRTGRVIPVSSVGVNPRLVITAIAGRVMVVNGGGAVHKPDPWVWAPGWLHKILWRTQLPSPAPGSVTVIDAPRM